MRLWCIFIYNQMTGTLTWCLLPVIITKHANTFTIMAAGGKISSYTVSNKLQVLHYAMEHGNRAAARAFRPPPTEKIIRVWRHHRNEDSILARSWGWHKDMDGKWEKFKKCFYWVMRWEKTFEQYMLKYVLFFLNLTWNVGVSCMPMQPKCRQIWYIGTSLHLWIGDTGQVCTMGNPPRSHTRSARLAESCYSVSRS